MCPDLSGGIHSAGSQSLGLSGELSQCLGRSSTFPDRFGHQDTLTI